MPSLSAAQLERFDQALRTLYVCANGDEFPLRLLDATRELVGAEVSCYTEIDAATGRVLNVADPPSDALDALLPVLAELQHQHPRLVDFQRTGETRALAVSDYLSRRHWHARELFQHFYGALGLEEQLSVMLPAPEGDRGGVMMGLALNRPRRTFTEADRALLDLLRPHMTLAWQNAQAVSALEGRARATEGCVDAVVRLRGDGGTWYVTERARTLLRRYVPEHTPADRLPARIERWIASVVSRGLAPNSADAVGPQRHARRIRRGRGVLSLRLVREPRVDGWLLLLRERPNDAPGALPPRLERVLDGLLRGDSEKVLAERLALSPHTVHEYVKQLYRGLGVSSRSELMARWIRRREGDGR